MPNSDELREILGLGGGLRSNLPSDEAPNGKGGRARRPLVADYSPGDASPKTYRHTARKASASEDPGAYKRSRNFEHHPSNAYPGEPASDASVPIASFGACFLDGNADTSGDSVAGDTPHNESIDRSSGQNITHNSLIRKQERIVPRGSLSDYIQELRNLGYEAVETLRERIQTEPFTKRELMDLAKLGLIDTIPRPTALDFEFAGSGPVININFIQPPKTDIPVVEPDAIDVMEEPEP